MRVMTIPLLLLAISGLALADDGKPTDPGEPMVAFYKGLTAKLAKVGKGSDPKTLFGADWVTDFGDLDAFRDSFKTRKVARFQALGTDLAIAFTKGGKIVGSIRFVYSSTDKPMLMFAESMGVKGDGTPEPLKAGPRSAIAPLHEVGQRLFTRLKDGHSVPMASIDQLMAWIPFPVKRERMEARHKKADEAWKAFLGSFEELKADGALLVGVGETILLCHDAEGNVVGMSELKWRVPAKGSDDPAVRFVVQPLADIPQR